MKIKIDQAVLEGTSKELSLALRKPPYEYPMTRIARLLGQTRSNVSRVLQGTGYEGSIKKPNKNTEIPNEVFETTLDIDIAKRYNMHVTDVKKRRIAGGNVRVVSKANLPYRQRLLVDALFGPGYTAGPGFESVLRRVINTIFRTPMQRNLMLTFYFGNRKTRGPTEKTYRAELRKELKGFFRERLGSDGPNVLVNQKVLLIKE